MTVGSPAAVFAPAPSYTGVATIAQGGMGYVELVFRREGRFLRWCARKRLHEQFRNDPTFRSMFMDEARLAGLVRHPNAVGVLDVGEDDDGPFLIMDFVEGVSLSRLIGEAVSAGRSIPMQVAVRICMDAAQGLHAAHEVRAEDGTVLRLVHRDVSPQNILIGFDGTVRVTDFGIAKALGNSSRTSAGVLKGNMGYLAPEQLRFEEPDRRSDFFSLGVTLYELLSGRRLYPNKTGFDGTRRILTEPPPDIGEVRSDVPPELCELLFEMLAKERDSRPATAADIAGRLEGILAVLIAEEGSLTAGDYMSQHFATQRQEQRAILAAHLKRIESEPVPTLRSIPASSQPGLAAMAGADERRRRRRPQWMVAFAVVTASVAGAVALWAHRSGSAPTAGAGLTPASTAQLRSPPVQPPDQPPVQSLPEPNRISSVTPVVTVGGAPTVRDSAGDGWRTKTPRAARAVAASTRRAAAMKDQRKIAKRSPRRARSEDGAQTPTDRARTSADPSRLAVPLFEQWQ